jgi:hypothetical protein
MIFFVHRREDGSIASVHEIRQPGYAEEGISDKNPELIDLIKPKPAVPDKPDRLIDLLVEKGVLTSKDSEDLKQPPRGQK